MATQKRTDAGSRKPAVDDTDTGRGFNARRFTSAVLELLKHPLVIALIAGLVAALLVPEFTRQWTDRQKEQEIKERLLDQMSTSATTAVFRAISLRQGQLRAAGGEPGENAATVYQLLRNTWQIQRASARSTIITYFPSLYTCWYSYERAMSEFLGLGDRDPGARKARIDRMKRWIEARFAISYVSPRMADGCVSLQKLPFSIRERYRDLRGGMEPHAARRNAWDALSLPTTRPRYRSVYAQLGEMLLIANERIVVSVVNTRAKNYSHGI